MSYCLDDNLLSLNAPTIMLNSVLCWISLGVRRNSVVVNGCDANAPWGCAISSPPMAWTLCLCALVLFSCGSYPPKPPDGSQNLGKALDRINSYSEIDFCFYGSRERRFLMVRLRHSLVIVS